MEVRKTRVSDLEMIDNIFDIAKENLRNLNIDQWQGKDGYPNKEVVLNDINNDEAYVIVDGDKVIATAMISIKPDPTYGVINGSWLNSNSYVTIHRVAIDMKYRGRGIANMFIDYIKDNYSDFHDLKADTHHDNLAMRSFLTKNGFKYCGIIKLYNGDERLAYQLQY